MYKSLEISLSTDYFGQNHNSTNGLEARVQRVDQVSPHWRKSDAVFNDLHLENDWEKVHLDNNYSGGLISRLFIQVLYKVDGDRHRIVPKHLCQ